MANMNQYSFKVLGKKKAKQISLETSYPLKNQVKNWEYSVTK